VQPACKLYGWEYDVTEMKRVHNNTAEHSKKCGKLLMERF